MLYVHEKIAKLGGVYLGGQVSSVEVQEAATIHVAQDDKGTVKKIQPVGYDNAKVIIDIILEDSTGETALEQLAGIERLFKAPEQTKAKLFAIVNEDCAARGISQVYFKSFTSKKIISESKMIASLDLWAPKTASITVVKEAGGVGTAGNTRYKSKGRSTDTGKLHASIGNSSKSKSKSPARDTRSTESGKRAAKNVVR